MQEEILIKASRIGTTIHFFNTDINENNYPTSAVPAIINLNSNENVPMFLNTFDGVFLTGNSPTVLWKRGPAMNYVFDTYLPNSNYISGMTFSQTVDSPLQNLQTDSIKNNFLESMNTKFTAGTTSYVFFEETLIDDLYANIKLERTFDVLNTLNIYNKISGEYSIRESTTGVVFGKLEAIQKISDANGNRIRIPLRNVPIGVFSQSTDFQTPNDLDNNGNRIRLNYRPLNSDMNSYPYLYESNYFNSESVVFDNQFLESAPLDGIKMHPTFKNVVYTNENGEFILHNIEVGPQILFFEVDFLKQGLTKDEVALNFFPYPPNFDNVSIDTIPHYFYRALPIDVVPSWGGSYQTGYTEVDISVNIDLRKWATYIIPPVAFKGIRIDNIDYQNISRAPLTVQVRDMSKFDVDKATLSGGTEKLETYPSKGIQMVEIQNINDKNFGQQWEWANEFSQIKDKALFFTYGYHAVKLPANIYDDEGYKTDKFGVPKVNKFSKGVWLCGYQLKVFLTREDSLYRTTGMAVASKQDPQTNAWGWYDRDHFHCSLYDDIYTLSSTESSISYSEALGKGIGKFPYEMAWNKNYPEKYSIPKPPKIENFTQSYYSYYSSDRPYLESPQYKDGDIIRGGPYSDTGNIWNGFGLSWYSQIEQYTDFSTDIIGGAENSDMYKYEPIGMIVGDKNMQYQYFGCYANGYCNGIGDVELSATSTVYGAEKYQRVEAGYGYFLFPSSMPRIVPFTTSASGFLPTEVDLIMNINADKNGHLFQSEQNMSGWNLTAKVEHYNSYSVINYGKSIAMDLGKKLISNYINNDKLNIYRIIDATSKVSYDTPQSLIKTYARLWFGGFADKYYSLVIRNIGEIDAIITNSFYNSGQGLAVQIQNPNSGTVLSHVGINSKITLNPGGLIVVNHEIPYNQFSYDYSGNLIATTGYETLDKIIQYSQLTFPGNAEYSDINNRYEKCKYSIEISVSDFVGNDSQGNSQGNLGVNGHIDISWNVDAYPVAEDWYVNSDVGGSEDCPNAPPYNGYANRFGITTFKMNGNNNSNPTIWSVLISQEKAFDPSQSC